MSNLKDVASLAGVSISTVSLALNGRKVNAATRERVIDCARRLKYVPSRIGRSLNSGRSETVCLLVMTQAGLHDVFETPLMYYFLQGVLRVLDRQNYSLRLEVKSHDDLDLRNYFAQLVGDQSLDGIILVPQFLRDYFFLDFLRDAEFPYVVLQPACFGDRVNLVDIENAHGGRLVGQLFARCGYRRVAIINGPERNIDAIERERGFFAVLKEAEVTQTAKRNGDFTITSGMNAMADLLEFRPEAVFCANDFMAAGAIRFLTESGIRIPDDIAVVGYDNNDISIGVVPALTTVDNRLREAGERIAEALLDLVNGKKDLVQESLVPLLIERASHLGSQGSAKSSGLGAWKGGSGEYPGNFAAASDGRFDKRAGEPQVCTA
jgi:DNA-binding LacI/PurR family transcriptional regulator